jgi:hypothetical protein
MAEKRSLRVNPPAAAHRRHAVCAVCAVCDASVGRYFVAGASTSREKVLSSTRDIQVQNGELPFTPSQPSARRVYQAAAVP